MKRLALLLFLIAPSLWAATYHAKPAATGTGDGSTAANAAALTTIFDDCGTAPFILQPGDIILLHEGEYDADEDDFTFFRAGAGDPEQSGQCTGTAAAPITLMRAGDEHVVVDCGDDTKQPTVCMEDGADVNVDPGETSLFRRYIQFQGIHFKVSSQDRRVTSHGTVAISVDDGESIVTAVDPATWVPPFQYNQFTVTTNGNTVTFEAAVNIEGLTGFCNTNAACSSGGGAWSTTSTSPRSKVRIDNDNYTITALTSATSMQVTPSVPGGLVTGRTMYAPWQWQPTTLTSTDQAGRLEGVFTLRPYGAREDIRITLCTSATVCRLSTTPVATGTVEAHAPSYSGAGTSDVESPDHYSEVRCKNQGCAFINCYFQDDAPYIFSQVADCTPGTLVPPRTCPASPYDEREHLTGGIKIEGNRIYYNGWIAIFRGTAHNGYYQQMFANALTNPASRSYSRNNLLMWPFQHCTQHYGGGELGMYTISDNICWGGGAGAYRFEVESDWPDESEGYGTTGAYPLGGSGSAATGPPLTYAQTGSPSRSTIINEVFDHNFIHAPNTYPYDMGFQKGSVNPTITRNYLISNDPPRMTRVRGQLQSLGGDCFQTHGTGSWCGTWGTVTIGDSNSTNSASGPTTTNDALGLRNVFMSGIQSTGTNSTYGGGPSGPSTATEPDSFNTTNYPGNAYLSAIPTTDRTSQDDHCGDGTTLEDGDCKWYSPDLHEAGRGLAAVHNPDSDATVRVDLCNFGAFIGQRWELYNANCAIPWSVCTPVVTDQTTATATIQCPNGANNNCEPIDACPYYVTVPSTTGAAGVLQPGYTDYDGSSAFPKPPDRGPEVVAFSLERRFAFYAAGTPTPTATNTSTPSHTPTPSPTVTPTRTLTPSNTPTATYTWTPSNPTVTNTFTPTNTATATATHTPTQTPTITRTPGAGGNGAASVDSRNCTLTAPMVRTVGGIGFPGSYLDSNTDNQGLAVCPFTILVDGDYIFWGRVGAVSASQDSFFWNVCNEAGTSCYADPNIAANADCIQSTGTNCPVIFDIREDRDPSDSPECTLRNAGVNPTHWIRFNHRKGGASCATAGTGGTVGVGSRALVPLTAGQYRLYIKARDSEAQFYYGVFTTDDSYAPTDPQPSPTPCVGCPDRVINRTKAGTSGSKIPRQ